MKEDRPSITAERVAMRRAAHQLLDEPKVFDDPLALRILGPEGASTLQADPRQIDTSPLSPYLRAFLAVRSRYAEDELALGFQRGVCQYVILGAGLDTFAYRNSYSEDMLRVFEVDYPATQTWKRSRLKEAGIILPGNLTFAPVDFETQTIEEGLRTVGYDPLMCTYFSWLGVTEYLSTEAVMRTLRFIASAALGSGIVFDYMISPELLSPAQRFRLDGFSKRVGSAGEPLHAFFDPVSLAKDLRVMGFRYVEDLGSEEINARYFHHRKDGLRVGSLSHIMNARV